MPDISVARRIVQVILAVRQIVQVVSSMVLVIQEVAGEVDAVVEVINQHTDIRYSTIDEDRLAVVIATKGNEEIM